MTTTEFAAAMKKADYRIRFIRKWSKIRVPIKQGPQKIYDIIASGILFKVLVTAFGKGCDRDGKSAQIRQPK